MRRAAEQRAGVQRGRARDRLRVISAVAAAAADETHGRVRHSRPVRALDLRTSAHRRGVTQRDQPSERGEPADRVRADEHGVYQIHRDEPGILHRHRRGTRREPGRPRAPRDVTVPLHPREATVRVTRNA